MGSNLAVILVFFAGMSQGSQTHMGVFDIPLAAKLLPDYGYPAKYEIAEQEKRNHLTVRQIVADILDEMSCISCANMF